MNLMRLILIIGLVMSLYGCSRGNLYIDNAGIAMRKFEIDGQTFALEPNGAMIMQSKKGIHKLKIMDENQNVLKDTVFTLNKGGLINLNKGKYIIWKDLYGDEIYRKEKLSSKTIEYQNWVFTGDFTELDSSQYYTEKNWDFDLDQPFPKDKVGWTLPKGEKYIIQSKIYRLEAFVKEVKKN